MALASFAADLGEGSGVSEPGVAAANPLEQWQVEPDDCERVKLLKRKIQLMETKFCEAEARLQKVKAKRKAAKAKRDAAEVRFREVEIRYEEFIAKRRKTEVKLQEEEEDLDVETLANGLRLQVAELETQGNMKQSHNWNFAGPNVTTLKSKFGMLQL